MLRIFSEWREKRRQRLLDELKQCNETIRTAFDFSMCQGFSKGPAHLDPAHLNMMAMGEAAGRRKVLAKKLGLTEEQAEAV